MEKKKMDVLAHANEITEALKKGVRVIFVWNAAKMSIKSQDENGRNSAVTNAGRSGGAGNIYE